MHFLGFLSNFQLKSAKIWTIFGRFFNFIWRFWEENDPIFENEFWNLDFFLEILITLLKSWKIVWTIVFTVREFTVLRIRSRCVIFDFNQFSGNSKLWKLKSHFRYEPATELYYKLLFELNLKFRFDIFYRFLVFKNFFLRN